MKDPAPGLAPRFFSPQKLSLEAEIELSQSAARHCSVLRLDSGDEIVVFDGEGGQFCAELIHISRGSVRARLISKEDVERESHLAITLAQCLSSADRMDITLQKSTELGVTRIVPIASERSVVKLSGEREVRRLAHWRNVLIAACEQCGRNRVPEIAAVTDLADFLGVPGGESARLLLAPDASRGLKSLRSARAVTLLVGPEGGFAPEERRHAEASGFLPIRFGPRVLRTETAPLAAIAAMQALWGDC